MNWRKWGHIVFLILLFLMLGNNSLFACGGGYSSPTANFSVDNATPVTGEKIKFSDNSDKNDGTISSWTWDFGSDAFPANANVASPDSVFYTSAGSKTVLLTITYPAVRGFGVYAAGSNSFSKTITVSCNNPTVAISPDPASVEYGSTLSLNGNPSGGSGIFSSHVWTGTGAAYLSAIDIQSPDFSGAPAGNYTLSYTVTDSYGCDETDDITVTVWSISTDSVTQIAETSATLYGTLTGSNMVEYGFYYATSAVDLLSPSATRVKAYDGSSIDLNNHSFSSDVSSLINRRAYYFRAYMKDASDNYTYGKVVRFLSEKRDFSLALDGDGDFLLIDSATTHDVINDWGADDNTFSVDFWMRNASTNIDKMVIVSDTCHSGTNSMGYLIAFSHGQFYFESGGYMNKTDSVVFDQEWHHIACTYNAKDVRIYVDDSLIHSAYSSFTLTRPTVDVNCRIGSTNPPDALSKFCYFNGNIDAMRFWNVALTVDQISELCYDNVKSNPSSNTITCIASGRVISGLTADNLTASLGFNVMSTQEPVGTVPVDIHYPSQDSLHALPFFHADTRLASDSTSFNIVAVGDAHPSPYLPRVHWRCNPTDSVWMNSSNWGGFAYPGQGIDPSAYPDVFPTLRSVNDSASCFYTIVDSSAIRPVVKGVPPVVQILVDKDDRIGTYRVDTSASKLRIIKGIYPRIFDAADIDSKDGAIDIEDGSMEAFHD